MDIRPDYANIEQDGKLEQVDPDEVAVGSIIVVQPGEKVPLDGVVISGNSTLNTSALTGESLPRDVAEGDEIISGCINMSGVLKIRTTKAFGESTVSKILDLVENASSRKSRSEAFISRFARIYTPAVCIGAVLLGVAVPLLRMAFGASAQWVDWVYRALTFLVVSCPCALVISIPLSFFAGIGGASKEGILIKGSNYLEAARSLGLTRRQTLQSIVLPQAIKNILPAIANEFVTIIKESSICYTIGVQEIMSAVNSVKSATFSIGEPLIIAACVYFCLTFPTSKIIQYFERRMSRGDRR